MPSTSTRSAGQVARLAAVRVGRKRVVEGDDPYETAFRKDAVNGHVHLRDAGLDGDEQADRQVHGGSDKAVCVYSGDHFDAWRRELRIANMSSGAFGENFTVAGQTEGDVCIGDVYRVGNAVAQVSQPRSPCWKLADRWQRPDLPKRVVRTGRTGWYLRVIRDGTVTAGDDFVLVERPYEEWPITRVNDVLYAHRTASQTDVAALAACEDLARPLRLALARRLAAEEFPHAHGEV